MTPSEVLFELVRAIGYGTVGVVIGLAFTWRTTVVHGVEVRVPTAKPDRNIWNRIIGVLLVVVAVVSIVQGAIFSIRQGDCNEQFRRTIQERGAASLEQSQLWTQLERDLVAIGPAPTLEKQQQLVEARERYVKQVERLNAEREANPYPDPRC